MKLFNNYKVALMVLCAVSIAISHSLIASEINKIKHPILIGSAGTLVASFVGEVACKLVAARIEKRPMEYLKTIDLDNKKHQQKIDQCNVELRKELDNARTLTKETCNRFFGIVTPEQRRQVKNWYEEEHKKIDSNIQKNREMYSRLTRSALVPNAELDKMRKKVKFYQKACSKVRYVAVGAFLLGYMSTFHNYHEYIAAYHERHNIKLGKTDK